MTTKTKTMTPAELTVLVSPMTASKFGAGRTALLQAYGKGLVGVPTNVEDTLGALARCALVRKELVDVDPGVARNVYNVEVADALREGRELPSPEQVEDMEREGRLHGIRAVALDQARQLFTDRLEGALADGDRIVAEHLRPVLLSLYDEARRLLKQHGPLLSGPAEPVIGASPAVGKAWSRFGAVAADVSTLRGVQLALSEGTCGHDHEGAFTTYRDDPRDTRVWGVSYGARRTSTARPWPVGHVRAYLGWMLSNRLDVWCPTGVERDERWLEVFKPAPVLAQIGGPGDDLGRWAS